MATRLPRSFFARDVLEVAPALLGCLVAHAGVTVRLTEVEAYAGHLADPGSHAYRGPTPRTAPMFGPPGVTYVYFTYGMHWCLNLVVEPQRSAAAVLLRAGEVVDGHDLAAARRPGVRQRDWCRGPARLTTTLAVSGTDTDRDFVARDSPITVSGPGDVDPTVIRSGPRVGVAGAGGDADAYPWRFWVDGEPTVSSYRPAKPRPRGGAR